MSTRFTTVFVNSGKNPGTSPLSFGGPSSPCVTSASQGLGEAGAKSHRRVAVASPLFHPGHAALPVISFRDDLSREAQATTCKREVMMAQQRCHLDVWRSTCTTRDNHRHMLLALLTETARYRAEKGEPLPANLLREFVTEINKELADDAPADGYVPVLDKLCRLHLFSG